MCFAILEGSQDRGCIEWRFEVPVSTGLEIDSVNLQLSSATFSSGVIHWRLMADKIQINLPPGKQSKRMIFLFSPY
jgi:hypothetical protein